MTKTNHTHHIMFSKHSGYWCYPGVENGSNHIRKSLGRQLGDPTPGSIGLSRISGVLIS